MVISSDKKELGQLDLDGVMSVIVTSRGTTFTSPFIAETAARNIPVIMCDAKFKPISVALPVIQHSDQTKRFALQATAKIGLKNKIWKQLITKKVRNQAELLGLLNANGEERLKRLASQIRPGDPTNIEAQAAQIYWRDLFGAEFRRDRKANDINIILNYGYAIIRSSMTSAILSAGLHPTFGIFHKNTNNPLCLVDDLMEPYRPIVDQVVRRLAEKNHTSLTPTVKRCMAAVVISDQQSIGRMSPLVQHMCNLSYSLYELLDSQQSTLEMPSLVSELELEAIISQC